MSDSNAWQSPGGPVPPPPPPVPFGAFPPQPVGGYPLPPGGWAPPPRPGLIPLAPLTLGTILGGAFRVLRRNPRPVVGISLIIHAVLAIVGVLVTGSALGTLTSVFARLSSGGVPTTAQTGSLLLSELAEFAVIALGLIGTQILQGIITVEVARGTVGERLPLRALWGRARGRLLVLVGWAFALVGVVVGFAIVLIIVIAIVAGVIGATGNTGGGVVAALILSFVLFLGGLVLALWIGIKLSLVPSILVLERLTLGKAMARSWLLTRGYFWRTLGIELLVWLMLLVAGQVIQTPVAIITLIFSGIANPNGTSTTALLSSLTVSQIASTIVSELVAAITGIIQTASTALIYLDLRIRKEGLDLALLKFVDDRAAGVPSATDPYLATAIPLAPPLVPGPPSPTGA